MKSYPMIKNFSAAKFAARYGFSVLDGKFYSDGAGNLVVPDGLPDDPPVQEEQDAPGPTITEQINALQTAGQAAIPQALKTVLLRLAGGK